MLKPFIKKLLIKQNLTVQEMVTASSILLENHNELQSVTFLSLLAAKGPSIDEIIGLIQILRQNSIPIKIDYPVLDIVGTGGDYMNTLNVSTISALLISACGVPVVKHGNRAVSSKCGSADLLEMLGYDLQATATQIHDSVDTTKFAFCFAPTFYPQLAKLAHIRQNMGISTIFNLVGPLCNPASAEHIILGVANHHHVELMAQVLLKLGTKCSLVFHGYGLDELSCIGPIEAVLIKNNQITNVLIDAQQLNLKSCNIDDLLGGDVFVNASMAREILSGLPSNATDTIILNAAVGLWVYGVADNLLKCVEIAKQRLHQGKILSKNYLQEIISRKYVAPIKRKSLRQVLLNIKPGGIIGEIKRHSPVAGDIATIVDISAKAQEYVAHGINAISVLTDSAFHGSLQDLIDVTSVLRNTSVPVLCKDFFINEQQIAAAAAAGTDVILIMVSVLHGATAKLVRIVHDFGLEALVEVHHLDEVEIAIHSGADIIGVNQRDLRDFSMHANLYADALQTIPAHFVKIAESGIDNISTAHELYKLGYNGVLVGTALSQLNNIQDFFHPTTNKGIAYVN